MSVKCIFNDFPTFVLDNKWYVSEKLHTLVSTDWVVYFWNSDARMENFSGAKINLVIWNISHSNSMFYYYFIEVVVLILQYISVVFSIK